MAARLGQVTRDRAIMVVRLSTLGVLAAAAGLTWLFSNLAFAFFSGQPVTSNAASAKVPNSAAPVQSAPPVITKVVHHPYNGRPPSGGTNPRPPGQGPAPPVAPPPPPCHSTPSHPC